MDSEDQPPSQLLIGIVGPCGSGKTTLAKLLLDMHYHARAIGQEHSFVPAMWRRITNPDCLVFLESSYEVATRRKKLDWTLAEFNEQLRRLANAKANANLIIETDLLSPEDVAQRVIDFLVN